MALGSIVVKIGFSHYRTHKIICPHGCIKTLIEAATGYLTTKRGAH